MDSQGQDQVTLAPSAALMAGSGYELSRYQASMSGMRLDTATPLGKIYVNGGDLRDAMQRIGEHIGSRQRVEEWASRLRFLSAGRAKASDEECDISQTDTDTAAASGGESEIEYEIRPGSGSDATADESLAEQRSCELQHIASFTTNVYKLVRTEPKDFPDCKHYIAVSYCWHSLGNAAYFGPPYFVTCGPVLRSAVCPATLLERVIAYAAKEDMRLIWIDQECIDQEDEDDKESGIQAMDIVYEQAACSLAVLQACIMEQRHLDALTIVRIDPTGETMSDAELRDLLEAFIIVIADPWFDRAWTLQESTSAARRMILMVRYDAALKRPDCFADCVAGNIEINMMWMHTLISANIQLEVERRTADCPEELLAMGKIFMRDWWAIMPSDPYDADDEDERRFVCNAAEAVSYLARRQNSVVADRLAIMANLCQYEVRLDTRMLDRLGCSLSACVLTLAVLNGDISLMVNAWRIGNGSAHHATEPAHGFSWMFPANLCLEDVANPDNADLTIRLRIDSLSLTPGLNVYGRLWIVDRIINVHSVLAEFPSQWQAVAPMGAREADRDDVEAYNLHKETDGTYTPATAARQAFGLSLVQYLRAQGFLTMAECMTESCQLEPLLCESTSLQSIPLGQKPNSPIVRSHITERYFVTPEGTIALARPSSGTAEPAAYCGLFEGTEKGDLIFTPNSNLLYPAVWKLQNKRFPTAWRVSPGETVYQCHGLVHGKWLVRSDDESIPVCLL